MSEPSVSPAQWSRGRVSALRLGRLRVFVPGWVIPNPLKMVAIVVLLLPTAPSGDGSNAEANFTSFGNVTFRAL